MEINKNQRFVLGLLIIAGLFMIFNAFQILALQSAMGESVGTKGSEDVNGVIPTGVPALYGAELGISFDGVTPNDPRLADQTIGVMKNLDKNIQLKGEDLQRYVDILYNNENGISCEYCCGAKSIIFQNGQSACGCAHSYAMRGLAKYLITQHGDEYTDEEIMEEVIKWKVLYFPTQMSQKAQLLEQQGIEFNYINLGSNKYRGLEQGNTDGGMVGGC